MRPRLRRHFVRADDASRLDADVAVSAASAGGTPSLQDFRALTHQEWRPPEAGRAVSIHPG
jgi:hypothetical protein